MARRRKKEPTPLEAVESILAERAKRGLVYFPVKHFSPVCAWHLDRLIQTLRPVGVLVEGPQDADPLIPYIVHPDSRPPFTIFSSFVDRKNKFGLNGVLSPSEEVPARYRAWWPMVAYAPEYVALRAGAEIGAELAFIDVPLPSTIPHHHVRTRETNQLVCDHHLASSAFFRALARRQRRRSFEELWHANFEVGGWRIPTEDFMRAVLLFAYCARNVSKPPAGAAESPDAHLEALEADGTLLREAHMRFVIDGFRKAHPEGLIVIVTGAYHSVALPGTKRKKARILKERNLETLLTGHSYRALATLYGLNRLPNYGQVVWEQLERLPGAIPEDSELETAEPVPVETIWPALPPQESDPFNAAAMRLLIEIMRGARSRGEGVSTADAVGAYRVARNLATLRGNREITREDLLDAVQMGYVKGDIHIRGGVVEKVTREVLTGTHLGRVTSEAGQAPLMRDFYDACKAHKLDVTGVRKIVRCDLHKQAAHRIKSAFLHQCHFLEIPLFGVLDKLPWNATLRHYRGPDIVSGENMELIIEQWAIQWEEQVDDRLLALADHGASVSAASVNKLRELLADARGSASDTTRLCLRCAQMMLLELFDEILTEVEDAIVLDASFISLVDALSDSVVLHTYRDTVATEGHRRLLETVQVLFNKAAIVLPQIVRADQESAGELLERLQTLVRITLTFEPVRLDRELLVTQLHELTADPEGTPVLRGAGFGVLYSLGATREKVVAAELDAYLLSTAERVQMAGAFLDGLFMSSKSIFMSSSKLLRAINGVLAELDWEAFKTLLPDLRRAFTQFIPREIDRISALVSEEIGLDEAPAPDQPVPEALALVGAGADARVRALLEGYL